MHEDGLDPDCPLWQRQQSKAHGLLADFVTPCQSASARKPEWPRKSEVSATVNVHPSQRRAETRDLGPVFPLAAIGLMVTVARLVHGSS